jgi:hypothetical protein
MALRGLVLARACGARQSDAPVRILLDQPPRAVEYQLGRLTNDELARIERREEAKYRLVYVALLTRSGLARELRDEAVAALVKIDRLSPIQVLLDALTKVPSDDGPTADRLATMLLGQPVDALRSQREALARAIGVADVSPALRAAYDAVMIVDNAPDAAWEAAGQHTGHMVELLRGVPLLPPAAALDPLARQAVCLNRGLARRNAGSIESRASPRGAPVDAARRVHVSDAGARDRDPASRRDGRHPGGGRPRAAARARERVARGRD